MTALRLPSALRRSLTPPTFPPGIAAIVVKELRGRMRGRRAFIVITIHVLLLAGFAWMIERLAEQSFVGSGGPGQATFQSASIGRGIFTALLLLQTLMVAVLAPAATAGAISGEREHQTLELLAVTPISSLAIVLGKLVSALAWVFVLVLASIPVTALVFVFGGVAPDDLIRGYIVLLATVIGFGSIGIFFSALTRRTGASTGLTFVVALALTLGSLFLWVFMSNTSEITSTGLRKPAPAAMLYLNPFVAQMDVACGAEAGSGSSCGFITGILGISNTFTAPPDDVPGRPVPMKGGVPAIQGGGSTVLKGLATTQIDANGEAWNPDGATAADVMTVESLRDRFWPQSVVSMLLLAVALTAAAAQFVIPTRRWRPSLPGVLRRPFRTRSA